MKPRLPISKKWTAFPAEYVAQIDEVFKQNFAADLVEAELVIEGRIYTEEILLRVGVLQKGRLKQANFEVSMNYSSKKQDALPRIHDCIDAAASMMNEYFQNDEEVDFPLTWKEYEFNKRALYLQFSTVNSSLEAQADALLGKSFEEMVQEDKETEDALERVEKILEPEDADENEYLEESLEEEDEEEPTEGAGPTIFSGKKKKTSLH